MIKFFIPVALLFSLSSCELGNYSRNYSDENKMIDKACKFDEESVRTLKSLGFFGFPGEPYDGQEMYLTGKPSNDLVRLVPSAAGVGWFIAFPVCEGAPLDKSMLPNVLSVRLTSNFRVTKLDSALVFHPDDVLPTDIYVALLGKYAIAFHVPRKRTP
jgi:hypothetical protein